MDENYRQGCSSFGGDGSHAGEFISTQPNRMGDKHYFENTRKEEK